jgi:exosortase A-associated hydrolase 2
VKDFGEIVNTSSMSGHLLQGGAGCIFVLLRQPPGARFGVLVAPPFAEEMNKCRRMVTELASRLTERGLAVVVPDLFGTGDSAGDFSDASWEGWQGDLESVVRWCGERQIDLTGLLAIRSGAALAISTLASGKISPFERTVLWQPVFDGAQAATRFLRLRVAASLGEQDRKETVRDIRRRLACGEVVDVAGYRLTGRLVEDLEGVANPDQLPVGFGRTLWIDVVRDESQSVPSGLTGLIESTRKMGRIVECRAVAGEPYWSSTEIVVNGPVVDASAEFFAEGASEDEQVKST